MVDARWASEVLYSPGRLPDPEGLAKKCAAANWSEQENVGALHARCQPSDNTQLATPFRSLLKFV